MPWYCLKCQAWHAHQLIHDITLDEKLLRYFSASVHLMHQQQHVCYVRLAESRWIMQVGSGVLPCALGHLGGYYGSISKRVSLRRPQRALTLPIDREYTSYLEFSSSGKVCLQIASPWQQVHQLDNAPQQSLNHHRTLPHYPRVHSYLHNEVQTPLPTSHYPHPLDQLVYQLQLTPIQNGSNQGHQIT